MTEPKVSAAIITRDGRDRLAQCLTSLTGFVDEIIVCDTGSTDGTVSFARELGVTVIEKPWSDSFADVRNAALAACTCEWVFSIDIDEVAVGTPPWLRPMLAVCNDGADRVDALEIVIRNERNDGSAPNEHREIKLFRRDGVTWCGRVHERLVRTDGRDLIVASMPRETVSTSHVGYSDPSEAQRKAERNVRLARLEVADRRADASSDSALAHALLDLGRSEYACKALAAAAESLEEARARAHGDVDTWRWATDFLIKVELHRDHSDAAWELIAEAEASGVSPGYCALLRAHASLVRGDVHGTRALLDAVTDAQDLNGRPVDQAVIAALRQALADETA